MVLPFVEDVLRSLVLREAAVFASSAAQSSGLATAAAGGDGIRTHGELAPSAAFKMDSAPGWPRMRQLSFPKSCAAIHATALICGRAGVPRRDGTTFHGNFPALADDETWAACERIAAR